MIAAIDGKFTASAAAIVFAGIFDNIDGKIARMTNTTSKFGIEYDSLADLVSFGVAPGILMYLWALKPLGRIGWVVAFLFMVCGALRLARFNTQVGTISSDYFVGLPIPAGAGMNATIVLFCHKVGIGTGHPVFYWSVLVIMFGLSFLMVSTIKYFSFKGPDIFRRKTFNTLVVTVLVLCSIAAQPSITLFLIGVSYVSSGLIVAFRRRNAVKRKRTEGKSHLEPEISDTDSETLETGPAS